MAESPVAETAAKPPAPETEESDYQTRLPPPDSRPAAAAVPPAPPSERHGAPKTDGDSPDPSQVILLARAGGIAVLAALLIPLLADWPDRWNVFAVLSPFEAVGVAVATWVVAQRLSTVRLPTSTAAGALIGFGGLTLIASLGLLRFTINRLDALSTLLAVVVLFGAVAILAAGIGCLRSPSSSEADRSLDPAPLVLGLAGAVLAGLALFQHYDGFSSLWSELAEGESAEFVFEPVLAVAAVLAGLVLLGARPRLAGGLLLAVGTATALHHLGVIVAAWRAIGEVGDVRAAGFIGVLGGLLVLAAGAWALRSDRGG